MSIEMPSDTRNPSQEPKKHKSKSKKKDRSSHEEKKRKHHETTTDDGLAIRPKKHRSDKKSIKQAPEETESPTSPFHLQTSSLFLPLAPVSQAYPLEGLCAEHLSPLILTYYTPFKGVILSYSNPRLSEKPFGDDGDHCLLQNIDEYAVSWAWVTADFLLFKPERGVWLEGTINLQNESHMGVVCWNLFNASIERQRLPKSWKWISAQDETAAGDGSGLDQAADQGTGFFVDEDGNMIEGQVRFRVKEIESSHDRERGFLSIEGTMLDQDAEKELADDEREKGRIKSIGMRLGGPKALGATNLGFVADSKDDEEKTKRNRSR